MTIDEDAEAYELSLSNTAFFSFVFFAVKTKKDNHIPHSLIFKPHIQLKACQTIALPTASSIAAAIALSIVMASVIYFRRN